MALPHSAANTRPVDEVGAVAIDQVIMGSCTHGRSSGLRSAARARVCPEGAAATEDEDIVTVDVVAGTIRNDKYNATFQAAAYPEFIRELIATGGPVVYTRSRFLAGQGAR